VCIIGYLSEDLDLYSLDLDLDLDLDYLDLSPTWTFSAWILPYLGFENL
jgi:hypothetical protein